MFLSRAIYVFSLLQLGFKNFHSAQKTLAGIPLCQHTCKIIALVEPELPSSVIYINEEKQVSFKRTVEHRNYISRYEVISRSLARSLVEKKMLQLGQVRGV